MLQGWRDNKGAKLWRFSLRPQTATTSDTKEDGQAFTVVPYAAGNSSDLQAFSAYDSPRVEALLRYFYAAVGFPVKSTWLDAIKAGKFDSWPGLTYQNSAKYCPFSDKTLKGHMSQTRQNIRSTKPKPPTSEKIQARPASPPYHSAEITNELHIWETPISNIYSNDTARFPIRSRSGNRYVMIIFHCDSNTILHAPLKTKADKHCLEVYKSIQGRLKYLSHTVDPKILDNEYSTDYRRVITEYWG